MLNCFRKSDSEASGRTSPDSADLPQPWSRYYNDEGAQLFYNRDSKLTSYLHPTTLKEVQAEGKTGRDAVVQMKAKTGEIYGVDYGWPPEGQIVYMPLELAVERQPQREEKEDGSSRTGSG